MVRLLESGRAAVRHVATLLSAVTHAAHNHQAAVQHADGTWDYKSLRDAQQLPKSGYGKRCRPPSRALAEPVPTAQTGEQALGEALRWSRPRAKMQHAAIAKHRARMREEATMSTKRHVAEVGASANAAPSGHGLSAQVRLSALHRRVRARLAAAEPHV